MAQNDAGNVLAALCSFILPGLGQLLQGRLVPALIMFVLNVLLWTLALGWVVHIYAAYDCAVWKK